MAVYMTKIWSFSNPGGPLQFGANGRRQSARDVLRRGDLVVLVATKGAEASPDKRGRILGMVEPTTEVVSTIDFEMSNRRIEYDENGNYRWPFSLVVRRAWKFDEPWPLFEDISSRNFGMAAASGIVPLTDEEAQQILRFPRTEVEVLLPVRVRARIEGEEQARRRGAPPPTTIRRGIMHVRREPAYTYAMEVRGASAESYKIGWAFDYVARQRTFNLAALPALGGLEYKIRLEHKWGTATQAFAMEQKLLSRFDSIRHPSNREIVQIAGAALDLAWIDCLQQFRRSRSSARR